MQKDTKIAFSPKVAFNLKIDISLRTITSRKQAIEAMQAIIVTVEETLAPTRAVASLVTLRETACQSKASLTQARSTRIRTSSTRVNY